MNRGQDTALYNHRAHLHGLPGTHISLRNITYFATDSAAIAPTKIPKTKNKLSVNAANVMGSIFVSNPINSRLRKLDAPGLVSIQHDLPSLAASSETDDVNAAPLYPYPSAKNEILGGRFRVRRGFCANLIVDLSEVWDHGFRFLVTILLPFFPTEMDRNGFQRIESD